MRGERPIRIVSPITVVLAIAALCVSADEPKTTFTGWAWLTLGQVASSRSEQNNGIADLEFEREWLDNFESGARMVRILGPHTKVRLHAMVSLQYPVVRSKISLSLADPLTKQFKLVLLEAAIGSSWSLFGSPDSLDVEFGYLPIKTNPQAQNLGEYLIRSGSYPAGLVSGFELADKVKLTGLHTDVRMQGGWGGWKNDVYFTNDMDVYPVHDFSLILLSDYTLPRGLVDIGAGVDFAHLIMVDKKKDYPYLNTDKFPSRADPRVSFVDSVTNDTTFYTFRGAKVAAHLTLDPKALFHSSIFGREDLKLYAEAAILGVRNYAGWYGNRRERIPVMAGFNVPTFHLLDVLALEVEYYPMKYWNATEWIWRDFSPVPYTGNNSDVASPYYPPWTAKTDDDWRWSLYASRKIGKYVRVSGQVASDHIQR